MTITIICYTSHACHNYIAYGWVYSRRDFTFSPRLPHAKDPWLPTRANRERPETSLTAVSFCSASPTLTDPDALVLSKPLEQVPPERERGEEKKEGEGLEYYRSASRT